MLPQENLKFIAFRIPHVFSYILGATQVNQTNENMLKPSKRIERPVSVKHNSEVLKSFLILLIDPCHAATILDLK